MAEDEKEMKNGFIINNKKITYISGPVGFFYLRPTKQVYDDGNKEYFPLVVLFGDSHNSEKNYCNPCECNDDIKPCCYRLDESDFIRNINNLGTKYTTDLYTETSFWGTEYGFDGGMMKTFTSGRLLRCYKPKKILCPWKNIRWQAGDIRFAGFDISKYYKGIKKIEITKYDEYPSKKYMENSYIENQFYYLLLLLRSLEFDIFNDFIPKTIFREPVYFRDFLMSIFSKDKEDFDLNRFSKLFFSMMTKDNSAIYKQIKKQTFRDFNEIREWEDFYVRSINYYVSVLIDKNRNIKPLKMFIYNIPDIVSKKVDIPSYNINSFKQYINLLNLILTSSFLDIYVISRMFKQPENGKRSEISFCYFGLHHVKNIRNLLLSTGAYELVASIEESYIDNIDNIDKINRCLDFSNIYVNLDYDLEVK